MKTFEIHITGEESILKELDTLGIKNITIELLTPTEEVMRTEYMSSFIHYANDYDECICYVNALLLNLKSRIIRVKVESPPYDEYLGQAMYAESHFEPIDTLYPISRNVRSGKLMATAREYVPKNFKDFITKWSGCEVEICLFDSYVEEDYDWFMQYGAGLKEAVCALIPRGDMVLAVSRKDNPTAFGLIGGKVDAGEDRIAALYRETQEETGLKITSHKEVFNIIDAHGYNCFTYLCDVEGEVTTTEKGVVKEVPWSVLFDGPFSSYNHELYKKINIGLQN